MYELTIILIILLVIAFSYAPVKQKQAATKRANPLYAWALNEGYDEQFAKDYIDHISELKIKKEDVYNEDDEDGYLEKDISAAQFYKSDYQHCYKKLKTADTFKKIDADEFETTVGKYRLKPEFVGIMKSEILTDEDIKNGVKKEGEKVVETDYSFYDKF